MKKIISAEDILKAKGYKADKFDTDGFMAAVAQFFIDNEVKDKLLIVSNRFLDVMTDEEYAAYRPTVWIPELTDRYHYYWRLTDEERTRGWKDQSAVTETGGALFVQELWDAGHSKPEGTYELDRPRIVVDSPYYKNALFLLQTMAGYTVEKRRKKNGYETALVSLI